MVSCVVWSGPAQGLGNLGLGLGLRPPPQINIYPLQKKAHLIVKGPKFYKKYEFFQIIVHFLLLVMLGILQILL